MAEDRPPPLLLASVADICTDTGLRMFVWAKGNKSAAHAISSRTWEPRNRFLTHVLNEDIHMVKYGHTLPTMHEGMNEKPY